MKKIKAHDKVCSNCECFTQYYEVGFHNFYPREYGFCKEKNSVVKEENNCVCFNMRKRIQVTAEEIENALAVVKDLKELMQK